jgi:hypothetical protein
METVPKINNVDRIIILEALFAAVNEWIDACKNYNTLGTVESYAIVRKSCAKIYQIVNSMGKT